MTEPQRFLRSTCLKQDTRYLRIRYRTLLDTFSDKVSKDVYRMSKRELCNLIDRGLKAKPPCEVESLDKLRALYSRLFDEEGQRTADLSAEEICQRLEAILPRRSQKEVADDADKLKLQLRVAGTDPDKLQLQLDQLLSLHDQLNFLQQHKKLALFEQVFSILQAACPARLFHTDDVDTGKLLLLRHFVQPSTSLTDSYVLTRAARNHRQAADFMTATGLTAATFCASLPVLPEHVQQDIEDYAAELSATVDQFQALRRDAGLQQGLEQLQARLTAVPLPQWPDTKKEMDGLFLQLLNSWFGRFRLARRQELSALLQTSSSVECRTRANKVSGLIMQSAPQGWTVAQFYETAVQLQSAVNRVASDCAGQEPIVATLAPPPPLPSSTDQERLKQLIATVSEHRKWRLKLNATLTSVLRAALPADTATLDVAAVSGQVGQVLKPAAVKQFQTQLEQLLAADDVVNVQQLENEASVNYLRNATTMAAVWNLLELALSKIRGFLEQLTNVQQVQVSSCQTHYSSLYASTGPDGQCRKKIVDRRANPNSASYWELPECFWQVADAFLDLKRGCILTPDTESQLKRLQRLLEAQQDYLQFLTELADILETQPAMGSGQSLLKQMGGSTVQLKIQQTERAIQKLQQGKGMDKNAKDMEEAWTQVELDPASMSVIWVLLGEYMESIERQLAAVPSHVSKALGQECRQLLAQVRQSVTPGQGCREERRERAGAGPKLARFWELPDCFYNLVASHRQLQDSCLQPFRRDMIKRQANLDFDRYVLYAQVIQGLQAPVLLVNVVNKSLKLDEKQQVTPEDIRELSQEWALYNTAAQRQEKLRLREEVLTTIASQVASLPCLLVRDSIREQVGRCSSGPAEWNTCLDSVVKSFLNRFQDCRAAQLRELRELELELQEYLQHQQQLTELLPELSQSTAQLWSKVLAQLEEVRQRVQQPSDTGALQPVEVSHFWDMVASSSIRNLVRGNQKLLVNSILLETNERDCGHSTLAGAASECGDKLNATAEMWPACFVQLMASYKQYQQDCAELDRKCALKNLEVKRLVELAERLDKQVLQVANYIQDQCDNEEAAKQEVKFDQLLAMQTAFGDAYLKCVEAMDAKGDIDTECVNRADSLGQKALRFGFEMLGKVFERCRRDSRRFETLHSKDFQVLEPEDLHTAKATAITSDHLREWLGSTTLGLKNKRVYCYSIMASSPIPKVGDQLPGNFKVVEAEDKCVGVAQVTNNLLYTLAHASDSVKRSILNTKLATVRAVRKLYRCGVIAGKMFVRTLIVLLLILLLLVGLNVLSQNQFLEYVQQYGLGLVYQMFLGLRQLCNVKAVLGLANPLGVMLLWVGRMTAGLGAQLATLVMQLLTRLYLGLVPMLLSAVCMLTGVLGGAAMQLLPGGDSVVLPQQLLQLAPPAGSGSALAAVAETDSSWFSSVQELLPSAAASAALNSTVSDFFSSLSTGLQQASEVIPYITRDVIEWLAGSVLSLFGLYSAASGSVTDVVAVLSVTPPAQVAGVLTDVASSAPDMFQAVASTLGQASLPQSALSLLSMPAVTTLVRESAVGAMGAAAQSPGTLQSTVEAAAAALPELADVIRSSLPTVISTITGLASSILAQGSSYLPELSADVVISATTPAVGAAVLAALLSGKLPITRMLKAAEQQPPPAPASDDDQDLLFTTAPDVFPSLEPSDSLFTTAPLLPQVQLAQAYDRSQLLSAAQQVILTSGCPIPASLQQPVSSWSSDTTVLSDIATATACVTQLDTGTAEAAERLAVLGTAIEALRCEATGQILDPATGRCIAVFNARQTPVQYHPVPASVPSSRLPAFEAAPSDTAVLTQQAATSFGDIVAQVVKSELPAKPKLLLVKRVYPTTFSLLWVSQRRLRKGDEVLARFKKERLVQRWHKERERIVKVRPEHYNPQTDTLVTQEK